MEHPFLVPILIDFSVSVCACVWGHFFVFLKTIRSNNFSFFSNVFTWTFYRS